MRRIDQLIEGVPQVNQVNLKDFRIVRLKVIHKVLDRPAKISPRHRMLFHKAADLLVQIFLLELLRHKLIQTAQ